MSSFSKPLCYQDNIFDPLVPNKLVRYTLDVKSKTLALGTPPKILSTQIPEFPTVPRELSTRKHRYLYPVAAHQPVNPEKSRGSGPAGAIQKVDSDHPELTETYAFENFEFPGEVAFVPKQGRDVTKPGEEDAGYLLVHVVNGRDRTTDLAIFDAEGKGSVEKGPIVRFQLPVFLPHLLHGNFFAGVTF